MLYLRSGVTISIKVTGTATVAANLAQTGQSIYFHIFVDGKDTGSICIF